MWKTRTLAAAVAALFIGGIATGYAAVRDDDRFIHRHDAKEHEREVRLTLPRTADGKIDTRKLIVEIRAAITRGARDIRFRDTHHLTAEDIKVLRELAAKFDFERVRIREDGRRVRVEFRDRDRDEARKRIEVRRDDDKFRKRIDIRDDDGRVRKEVRIERREDRAQRPEKLEKANRAERPEKAERAERFERPERNERAERPERGDRGERPDRSGRH